jgi:uncharacterized protein YjiS (DUF1127 family)
MPGAGTLNRPSASVLGFVARRSGALARIASAALARLVDWQERAEQRHHLAAMDERMLKDIGVSHADALRESEKPFWRA